MTVHILKCWRSYFDAVKRGDKTFEVRRDDRGFQKGDVLRLQCVEPRKPYHEQPPYSGLAKDQLDVEVTYVLSGGQFGIEAGHVVMGIRPWRLHEAATAARRLAPEA